MNKNAEKRQQILEVLYQQRQSEAGQLDKFGWMSEGELKKAVDDTPFALSVLIELGYITSEEYELRILGPGVLACEMANAQ